MLPSLGDNPLKSVSLRNKKCITVRMFWNLRVGNYP